MIVEVRFKSDKRSNSNSKVEQMKKNAVSDDDENSIFKDEVTICLKVKKKELLYKSKSRDRGIIERSQKSGIVS